MWPQSSIAAMDKIASAVKRCVYCHSYNCEENVLVEMKHFFRKSFNNKEKLSCEIHFSNTNNDDKSF